MSQAKLIPIPLKNLLAPTPQRTPQWPIEISLKSGEKVEMVDPRSTRALVSLMDMQAVLGGAASHFGGPSAFAELMGAVYGLVFHRSRKTGVPWHEVAHIINDAGHCENGIYALKANYSFAGLSLDKLKGFRSIESQLTGHGESHLFPEGVYLSNGPLGSSLPQAQGLAYADCLAGRRRLTFAAISDGACMEGEAREALAAIPGLAKIGKMAPFVLVISDNNTKLTGRIDADSFSMQPTFDSLNELGWKVFRLADPHNLQKCVSLLEEAMQTAESHPQQPIAIIAKTIKGYGVKKVEESSSGGHGFPLTEAKDLKAFIEEIYSGAKVPEEFLEWAEEMVQQQKDKKSAVSNSSAVPSEKIQKGVSQALIKKRKEGLPLFSISSDLAGSTGVREFQKAFPECTQDVGVAESNMISMAAGLSKEGFIPVVDTFAQFGVTKGALPLTMASLSQAPVIAFFSHTGFQDAADGASHQALSWLSMTASIPDVECYALTCSDEAEALVAQAIDRFVGMRKAGEVPPSTLFFLGRENFPLNYGLEPTSYRLGQGQFIHESEKSPASKKLVPICPGGSLLSQALKAAKELEALGIRSSVVNPSCLNKPDLALFADCLRLSEGRLITVEDHQLVGGMGAILAQALLLRGIELKLKSIGVRGGFGQSAYQAGQLYQKHGMDAKAIVQAALEI
ncbi:MAG: transketolase [Bdellovibrionales bacterium]|nr:transketolase [Bdellovibrionales bacterium]